MFTKQLLWKRYGLQSLMRHDGIFFNKELAISSGRFGCNRYHKSHRRDTGSFYRGRELAEMSLGKMRTYRAFLEAWPFGWALKGRWNTMEVWRQMDGPEQQVVVHRNYMCNVWFF